MVEMVHVLPGEGRLVKLPVGKHGKTVPKEGVMVPRNQFVERRLACGDLVLAPADAKAEAAQAPEVAKKGA